MKAQSFRIGNYLKWKNNIFTICLITEDSLDLEKESFYYNDILVSNKELKPIQLTEEWLLKFGFKLDAPFYRNDTFQTRKDSDGFLVYQFSDFLRRVYYVHQLQNLYFALTGNELEVVQPTE